MRVKKVVTLCNFFAVIACKKKNLTIFCTRVYHKNKLAWLDDFCVLAFTAKKGLHDSCAKKIERLDHKRKEKNCTILPEKKSTCMSPIRPFVGLFLFVPNASKRGTKSEKVHNWVHWLHNPAIWGSPTLHSGGQNQKGPTSGQIGYIAGGPQHFTAGDKIRKGPQVGGLAT